jgi:hypothetical protein
MFGSRFADLDLTRGVSERLAAGIADVERAGSARRSFTGTSADMAAALSSRGMGHMARAVAVSLVHDSLAEKGRSCRDGFDPNLKFWAPRGSAAANAHKNKILDSWNAMLRWTARAIAIARCVIGLPQAKNGSATRICPANDFSQAGVSRLQIFRNVPASKFAHPPGRSYRCEYSRRAAGASTSGPIVLCYLRTHRTC